MTRRDYLFHLVLIAAVLAAIAFAYPQLPNRVAVHWGFNLKPNGYKPKWVLFLLGPGLMTAVLLFTRAAQWLSPKQFNVDEFRPTFCRLMLILQIVLAYVIAVILWAGTGHPIHSGRAIMGGMCIVIAAMGNMLGKVRRNFFIGVRTPWTLASDRAWNATHRFAAKTWIAGGLLGFTLIVSGARSGLAVATLLAGVLAPYFYSLIFYKRMQRHGEL